MTYARLMKNLTGIQARLNVTGEEIGPPFPPFCPRPAALANAERTRALMVGLFGAARIVPASDHELWCVLVGATSTLADAEALAAVGREARPIIAVCHGLNAGGVS